MYNPDEDNNVKPNRKAEFNDNTTTSNTSREQISSAAGPENHEDEIDAAADSPNETVKPIDGIKHEQDSARNEWKHPQDEQQYEPEPEPPHTPEPPAANEEDPAP